MRRRAAPPGTGVTAGSGSRGGDLRLPEGSTTGSSPARAGRCRTGSDARHLRRNGRVSRPERAHHPHAESREPQSLHPGSRVGDPGRRAQATPLRPKPELQGRRHQAGGVEAPSGGARLRGARRHHHELRGRPHAVGILADLRGVRDTADGRTRARGARSPGHRRHREAAGTSSRSTPTRAARSGRCRSRARAASTTRPGLAARPPLPHRGLRRRKPRGNGRLLPLHPEPAPS